MDDKEYNLHMFKTVALYILTLISMSIGWAIVDDIYEEHCMSKAIKQGVNPIVAKMTFKGFYEDSSKYISIIREADNNE